MIIQHNMAAVNTMMQLGITNTNLKKSAERLSSGYSVNRAADDAAALSISEKKRAQIRGLARASKNAEDGVGFVRTGDGAMGRMEDLLQRMRELSVQALNDAVYSPEDQAALQMEFDELQSEIDRINDDTEFNKRPVFEHYPNTYSSYNGNRYWSQDQLHTIDSTNQSLTIKYKTEEGGPEKEMTLTIPQGTYTTQELIDEMDDVVTALGDAADGLYLEFSGSHTCNMVLREGSEITDVYGGLSYFFFDQYGGSKVGALIGTTIFDPNFALQINHENNELKFTINYFDGTSKDVDILIDEGYYTRGDMINYLNGKLAGTGMKASEYGDYCIQVGGEDGVITGLKGNMFKIDEEGQAVMISVFYDNTKYGTVKHTASVFTGGPVLVSRYNDTECNKFKIDDTNNTLHVRVGLDDTAPYKEIKLENKSYTMAEMVAELQNKMDAAGLNVNVTSYGPQKSDTVSPNGNQYYFSGIKIQSNESATDIKVEFDESNSTAFDTLFVKRTYTDEGRLTGAIDGKDDYSSPILTGGRIFGMDNIPVTLGPSNNSFMLHVEEKKDGVTESGNYTIKLSEERYDTVDDIIKEINIQINNGPVGINGKIQAVNYGGAIRFRAANGNRSVTSITFADQNSDGYEALFVGKKTVYSTSTITSSGYPPKVELDTITGPVQVDGTNDKVHVNVGGEDRVIDLPHRELTPEELAELITNQLKGKSQTDTNNYVGTGTGTTQSTTANYSQSGNTYPPTTIQCNAEGTGGAQDGTTTVVGGTSAKYTVPVSLPNSTTIDDSNRQFKINVNGTDYEIMLDKGAYSPSQLASQFQQKLNDKITSGAHKVTVSTPGSGNRLVFETNIKGSGMKMSFGTDTSTFLKSISKNETPAVVTTKSIQSPVNVDGTNNSYTMSINGTAYTVQLDNGSYSRSSFAEMLQRKLREKGAAISVSPSGSGLRFETTDKGSGTSIQLDTANGGSAMSAMFGDQISKTSASAQLQPALPGSTTNSVKTNNEAKFTVQLTQGGISQTINLDVPRREGGYTNSQLREALRQQLSGTGVNVSLDYYNNLTFTTTSSGADVSLSVTGSVETTSKAPDVQAVIDPNTGKLILQSGGASISVKPSENSPVLQPIPQLQEYHPQNPVEGSVEQAKYTLKTNPAIRIPESTKISDYNKTFQFTYVTPSGVKDVTIEMEEKEYSYPELQRALQQKLDDELGSGEMNVNVSGEGIQITAGHYGQDYYLSNMKGGFHDYVLEGKAVRGSDEEVILLPGRQVVSDTYIVGRKDVRNNTSHIEAGINDKLTVDVTINGAIYPLAMTLDPGNYNSDDLVAHIQEKLNEQVRAAGLPEQSILAGVGVYDSGVAGADDSNALFFYVNKDVELQDGDYRIDGLGGTALFEIFYKTEGNLIPAYLTGTKDISNGVEILPGENTFSIDVDGATYNYTIPEGEYTCEGFLDTLKKVLENPNAHLTPSLSGNALKVSYEKMGEHTIENVKGPAKNLFFNDINGRTDHDSELWLQIGANAGQGTTLQKFNMSTMGMGINSITISGHKYANKALVRLDEALGYLNEARGKYGAKQNRLEYTIKGNDNTAENLQASESRDRDADMADEMVQHSKSQVLQQTGTAMLTQANQHTQRVLSLLR